MVLTSHLNNPSKLYDSSNSHPLFDTQRSLQIPMGMMSCCNFEYLKRLNCTASSPMDENRIHDSFPDILGVYPTIMHSVNRCRVGRSPVLYAATEKFRTEMERTSETVMKLMFLVVCDVNADAFVKAFVVDSRYCATIFMVDMPFFEQI